MAVGIDTANESYTQTDRAYGSIPVGETTGSVTVQFDGYIERSPSSEAPHGDLLKEKREHGADSHQFFRWKNAGWQRRAGLCRKDLVHLHL